MRPINLIPDDVKRRRVRRDTGFAPYVLTAFMAVLVAGVLAYVLMQNQITSKEDQVAEISAQAKQATANAEALSEYGKFATMKQARVVGLTTIAQSRFPWAEVLLDISKAIPSNAWLTEVTARVSADAGTTSGESSSSSSGPGGDRGIVVPGPSIQMTGCSYRQRDVARFMTRMRNVSGVRQVLLKESAENVKESKGSSSSSGEVEGGCGTDFGVHKFEITLTFSPGPAAAVLASLSAEAAPAAASSASGSDNPKSPKGSGGAKPESQSAQSIRAESQ